MKRIIKTDLKAITKPAGLRIAGIYAESLRDVIDIFSNAKKTGIHYQVQIHLTESIAEIKLFPVESIQPLKPHITQAKLIKKLGPICFDEPMYFGDTKIVFSKRIERLYWGEDHALVEAQRVISLVMSKAMRAAV